MTVKNIIHEPFGSEDVETIIKTEVQESGVDNLKDRVTARVRESTWIFEGNLPERVRAWIHQLYLHYALWTPLKKFTGKLAKPIDLRSIPNRTI